MGTPIRRCGCLVSCGCPQSRSNRNLIGSILAEQSTNPTTIEEAQAPAADGPVDRALEQEVAGLIVDALNLEMAPGEIDPEAPLFGEGLGLDSIDILEVALVVSKKYGFQLRSDDDDNTRIFQSLRSLCQHIALHRLT